MVRLAPAAAGGTTYPTSLLVFMGEDGNNMMAKRAYSVGIVAPWVLIGAVSVAVLIIAFWAYHRTDSAQSESVVLGNAGECCSVDTVLRVAEAEYKKNGGPGWNVSRIVDTTSEGHWVMVEGLPRGLGVYCIVLVGFDGAVVGYIPGA